MAKSSIEATKAPARAGPWWMAGAQRAVIAVAILVIYGPVLHGDWLWDDDVDITDNAIIKSSTGLRNIWFAPGSQLDYYPVKASLQWVQWHLWGRDTLGYHLTNVGLHFISALLVWRLLGKFKLKFAWLGGLLFAIHPVNVESVAWMAELKNALSLPPFLLAMGAWIDYEEKGRRGDYLWALGLFLIAMLCKTTMVMFPFVILLYAWWRRGTVGWRDLKTSGPFFAVSLALGLVTIWLQSILVGENHSISGPGEWLSRFVLAGLSFSFYFLHCFWPVGLSPIYPKWTVDPSSWAQLAPWPIFAGILAGLWANRKTWGRHVLLGLGFFAIILAPFLGLERASYMNFTWVMDHFLYVPIIGLIGGLMLGWEQVHRFLPLAARPYVMGLGIVALGLLTLESRAYARIFADQETLWNYTLQRNPQAWPAYNDLGNALLEKGKLAEALQQFDHALQIDPNLAEVHANVGAVLMKGGRIPEALAQYEQAAKLNPRSFKIHNYLGMTLVKLGRLPEALDQFEQSLALDPANFDGHAELGLVLAQMNRFPEALEQLETALSIDPDDSKAHYNLGVALIQLHRLPEAMEQFQAAVKIAPDYVQARYNLGVALAQVGRIPEAIEQYEAVLRIDPNYADVRENLARLRAAANVIPVEK